MGATTANAAEFTDGGKPLANPTYLVDTNGNPISSSNGLPVNVVAGTIAAENPSVSATGAGVPADATYIGGLNAGNLVGLLVDSSGRLYVNVNSLPALAAGTNVIGHVISDSGSVVQANAGTNLNTSLLALESGGNLAGIKTDADTLVPGVQGWIAATGTGTATTDDSLTFASQVRKVVLYNAASVAVPLEFDAAASATSFPIQPGQYLVFDNILCTVVHVYPSATLPINTTAGLYVKGWK